ncbi:hypothetical protein [uncultured Helicobacter sp.]
MIYSIKNAGVLNLGDILNVAMARELFGLQVKRLWQAAWEYAAQTL